MNRFRFVKQLAITAGLLAMCGLPAAIRAQETPQNNSQGPDQASHGGQKHEDDLADLNLSDDQKAQVNKIHADMRTQMAAVKNDSTLTPDQQTAKMHEIRKATREQVRQVLTPAQRKQWKSDEMARKAARQQQNGQAAPPQQ